MASLKNSENKSEIPVLYSFRRCPYAMRARMAIFFSGQTVELRDILLKNKPQEMLDASPKATVPVLILQDGTVLEESRDILYWALETSDPKNIHPDTPEQQAELAQLIDETDGPFKSALDKYKYHVRFPENSREAYREEGERFLQKLENRLSSHSFLMSDHPSSADIAVFPFVRQFANSDRSWFDNAPYPAVQKWLEYWVTSAPFKTIMAKRTEWAPGVPGPIFPDFTQRTCL
ncbi:glutathione S-transferase [Sneathiella sp.]|jgi:glutathione S-transferase|uniref:glutathione S-transferase n=1 Tax=Sneathiella sp. TaxID=1964365 RepID=UPI0039E649B7